MRGNIACPHSVAFIGNAALRRWFGVDPRSAEMPLASPYNSTGSNPISFIDPDGENPLLIGALIGLTTNGIGNLFNGENFFKGGFDAAFFGAAGGMISAGIGNAAQSFAGSWSNLGVSSFQAGAHGLSGGGLSAMQGGNFWHGAAAGFISSSASSGIAALNGNGVMQMGGAALSGGISAEIAGGDFWRGAGVGATVAGLNHLAHRMQNDPLKTTGKYEKSGKLVGVHRVVRQKNGYTTYAAKGGKHFTLNPSGEVVTNSMFSYFPGGKNFRNTNMFDDFQKIHNSKFGNFSVIMVNRGLEFIFFFKGMPWFINDPVIPDGYIYTSQPQKFYN